MNRMFDTPSALRDLEEAGIDRKHAQAIVTAIGNAGEQLVTKRDIEHLASKAFVLQVGIGIVLANAALTAGLTVGLIKLL